jgi:quinol monooxygenase YgiN
MIREETMKLFGISTSITLLLFFFASLIQFTGCAQPEPQSPKTMIVKQSEGQLSLAVVIKAKEGHEETVKNACIGLLEPTRKEKGCINYTLHMDPNDNGRFMFYENWESAELWGAHLETPHIKAFGDNIGPLLAEELDVTNWKLYD